LTTGERQDDPRDDPRWELVRAAARTTVSTPPGLVNRVLQSVRGLRGHLLSAPIDIPFEGGKLRVSERVVVLIARRLGAELARELDGVHVSAVALEADGLQVLITVRYGVAADEAAALLRTRLRAGIGDQLGAPAPPVHVHIVDVHPN
jgi:hypothetical protein